MSVAPNRRDGKKVPLSLGPRLDWPPFSRGSARSQPVAGDGLGDGGAIKNVAGRLGHFGKDPPDLAGGFILAVGTAAIGNLAQARQRRDRAVDNPKHASESDLIGRRQQSISAEPASAARDNAVALQVEKDLLEKLARDALLRRDVRDHHIVGARERDQRPQGISCLLRNHLWICSRNPICWIEYRVRAVKTTVCGETAVLPKKPLRYELGLAQFFPA
jgi:hypothetical protein